MKIRKYFLELRLKMWGMFLETQCIAVRFQWSGVFSMQIDHDLDC